MPRSKSANAQAPVSDAPLTALELQVTGEFVSAAGRTYIDHSCNDFELPDTPVRRALVQAAIDFVKQEGSDADPLHAQDSVIYFHDHLLMQYLGPRWAALSEQVASGPINPPPCREELETMASVLDMLARNESKEYATLREAADYALPLTKEGQQFAEAAIRHAAGGADTRIEAAEFGYDIHTVKCLKYLAARCQALAAISPDKGLPFTSNVAALSRLADASTQQGAADSIPVFKRPGVGPSWLKAWKKSVAEQKIQLEKWPERDLKELKRYAAEGKATDTTDIPPKVSPAFRSWELAFSTYFVSFAFARTSLVEDEALMKDVFPATQWRSLFGATYLHCFSSFCEQLLFPVRFPSRERPADAQYPLVHYAALGVVMGFREHAFRVVRLQLLAHRLELFCHSEYYPAAQTLLRIFADYFGEPALTLKGEALTHPVYNALAKHWRHPEAEPLVPVLLAVCDEHTRRNVHGKPYGYDYDFQFFARTPVEILLVFKLRQELGLPNPQLDHPLMNTPLGVLPKAVPFEYDDLLAPVVKRMRQDGFDEEAILADFVAAVKKQ